MLAEAGNLPASLDPVPCQQLGGVHAEELGVFLIVYSVHVPEEVAASALILTSWPRQPSLSHDRNGGHVAIRSGVRDGVDCPCQDHAHRGRTCFAGQVLEGLDEVPWDALHHAYGTAEDVPDILRRLVAPHESAEEAVGELFGNIWHQGSLSRRPPTPCRS